MPAGIQARHAALVLSFTFALALSGCGGARGTVAGTLGSGVAGDRQVPKAPAPVADRNPGLPRPSELASKNPEQPRRTSYVEADLLLDGNGLDLSLPSRNVTPYIGTDAGFEPANQPGATATLAASSYGTYRFSAPGYDRGGIVRLTWNLEPSHPQAVYIGLSNWATDTWDWYQGANQVDIDSLLPYFDAQGELLLVVLVSYGNNEGSLRSLRLGAALPQASLVVSPAAGPPPLNVDLDASASLPGEGSITKYEWDLDGDGSFELDSGLTATANHEYSAPGIYQPAVKVSNSFGESKTLSKEVKALDYWQHTYLPAGSEVTNFRDMVVDSDSNVYCVGVQDNNAFICKLNAQGELLWAKTYKAADRSALRRVVLDSAGDLVCVGDQRVSGKSNECLIQEWDSDGMLLWSRCLGSSEEEFLLDVKALGADIYACGSTSQYNDPDSSMLVLNLDGAGTLLKVAARSVDANSDDDGQELLVRRNLLTAELQGITVIGNSYAGANDRIYRADWGGALASTGSAYYISEPGADMQIQAATYSNSFVSSARYRLAERVTIAGIDNLFLLSMSGSGASEWGVRATGLSMLEIGSISAPLDGAHIVSGGYVASNSHGFAARFSELDGSLIDAMTCNGDSGGSLFTRLIPYGSGMLGVGAAAGPDQAWAPRTLSAQGYEASWAPILDSVVEPAWDSYDSQGNVLDLAASLELDTGVSFDQALVKYDAVF